MASGDESIELWLPNSAMRSRSEVPAAKDIDLVDGFIPAHYEYERPEGGRHYALTNKRDFQRIIDGYGCANCLAKFKRQCDTCPLCGHTRDVEKDVLPAPREWLPGPATVTNA